MGFLEDFNWDLLNNTLFYMRGFVVVEIINFLRLNLLSGLVSNYLEKLFLIIFYFEQLGYNRLSVLNC